MHLLHLDPNYLYAFSAQRSASAGAEPVPNLQPVPRFSTGNPRVLCLKTGPGPAPVNCWSETCDVRVWGGLQCAVNFSRAICVISSV